MSYALINSFGIVVNVMRWDGITPWQPLAGHQAMQLEPGEACAKGWIYLGSQSPRFAEPLEL